MVIQNKRAQEFNWTTLIVIVLLVGIGLIYFLFFTDIGGRLRGAAGVLPGDLTTAVASCQAWAAAGSSTTAAFCDFKYMTLSEGKQWVNCKGVYREAKRYLNETAIGYTENAQACSANGEQEKCLALMKTTTAKPSVSVNLQTCKALLAAYTCANLGGELKTPCVGDQKDLSEWLSGANIPTSGNKCCYPAIGGVVNTPNSGSCTELIPNSCQGLSIVVPSTDPKISPCKQNSNCDVISGECAVKVDFCESKKDQSSCDASDYCRWWSS